MLLLFRTILSFGPKLFVRCSNHIQDLKTHESRLQEASKPIWGGYLNTVLYIICVSDHTFIFNKMSYRA